jgi:hypothetical protein
MAYFLLHQDIYADSISFPNDCKGSSARYMPTYTPINQYAAYINCPSPPTLTITFTMLMSMNVVIIPPEYENIKDRILENIGGVSVDKNQVINDVGIATAVKVRPTTPVPAYYL